MNRFVLSFALAATVLSAGAARAADSIGIPACDDFLTKYEACVSNKIPAAQQPTFKSTLDQTRASWTAAAKSPSGKPALEGACKSMTEQMKTAMTPYGCTF